MCKPIRVLQVIDSLDHGGSEKMAVQIANALVKKVEVSALVCTRKSGALKNELSDQVLCYTANKKHVLDFKAFVKLRAFIKSNRITIIHAHSSSFFWCTLLKYFCKNIKLIWHDHYGFRSKTSVTNNLPLYFLSFHFNNVITVNQDLKQWALKNLNCKSVDYLPNFTSDQSENKSSSTIILKGESDALKIVHVANLRPEKDHLTALKAIQILISQNFNITYHVIGEYNPNSKYFQSLNSFIEDYDLGKNVFIYGSQSGISHILKQGDVGLLSSYSEGLPLSLLEYIHAGLPVVVTDVGQCKAIVGEFGQVVKPQKEKQIAKAILKIYENEKDAKKKALKLKENTSQNYNSSTILEQLIDIYDISLRATN